MSYIHLYTYTSYTYISYTYTSYTYIFNLPNTQVKSQINPFGWRPSPNSFFLFLSSPHPPLFPVLFHLFSVLFHFIPLSSSTQ